MSSIPSEMNYIPQNEQNHSYDIQVFNNVRDAINYIIPLRFKDTIIIISGGLFKTFIENLFDDIDVNSNKLGATVDKRNKKLSKILHNIADMKLGNYQDNTINLNKEIPRDIVDKIIPFKTKVMNHYSSYFRDYSAACNDEVPEIWKEFKAEYTGFSNGYGDIKGKFRLGTKIVSPFVICNYGQNDDAILEIRNIEINIKDKPKFV